MEEPEVVTAQRWRLYRMARERGVPDGEAYDRYVHPRTRIDAESVIKEAMDYGLA